MYNLAIEVFKLSEVRVPLGTVLTQVGQDLAVMLRSDRICTKSLRTIMIKRRHLSAAFVIAWLAGCLQLSICHAAASGYGAIYCTYMAVYIIVPAGGGGIYKFLQISSINCKFLAHFSNLKIVAIISLSSVTTCGAADLRI